MLDHSDKCEQLYSVPLYHFKLSKMSKVITRKSTGNIADAAASSPPVKKGIKRRNERNILTFYEKIAVIHYYNETNISRNSLAKMFHCCATQIRRILDKKHELLQQQATMSETDASIIIEEMTRKRRKFEMSAISFILHQWVERCRQLRLRKSITNQTLKETATRMAAILNLPAFRPSYRWLNRFRSKYKYNEPDLSVIDMMTSPRENGITDAAQTMADLAVEDIIIEFKDSLPSFMQKEIATITSSIEKANGVSVRTAVEHKNVELIEIVEEAKRLGVRKEQNKPNGQHKSKIIQDDREDDPEPPGQSRDEPDLRYWQNNNWQMYQNYDNNYAQTVVQDRTEEAVFNGENNDHQSKMNSSVLLANIFPHLAVVYQFALLNSDVKALELISQLGVHMQAQALAGAYKDVSLATSILQQQEEFNTNEINGDAYADMDDIVLME